ncbi:site-specific DNA-methyltransferase [Rufibacter soli]
MNNYNQLKDVLNDIFELNKADLDFGIYRIMNQKRKQVNEFIDKQLPEDIKKALSETQSSDKAEIENELKEIEKQAIKYKFDLEQNEEYVRLRERLKIAENTDVLEQEVFSHLANFFRRYYKDGDFISMRRYKKDVYAIPYEGEEVKLHWANHDQYYIKSSENFKHYSFHTPNGKKVTFQLKEVSTEQNNNKTQGDGDRRFAICIDQPVEENKDELLINFIYEPSTKASKQDVLLNEALELLSEKTPSSYAAVFTLSSTEKNSKRTLLEKHLNDYVAKNSFDYFIHKDLGGFLSRELDFYIKNEVLYLDDINTIQADFFVAQLSKVKAIKIVAQKVIDFLAQIENFQKKLWLKKKFVIRTDYCITLDKIPSSFYPEIIQNKAQLAEWKRLFDVDIQNDGQLTFEQFLVLDTKFFDENFKDRLLGQIEDLEDQINGILINSENFQATSLLMEKYQESISNIYIDPPYNSEQDRAQGKFVYKDNFESSSWLTMMKDRILLLKDIMSFDANIFISIDDNELNNLKKLNDQIFSKENFIELFSWTRTLSPSNLSKKSKKVVEFVLCYEKNKNNFRYVGIKSEAENDNPLIKKNNNYKELTFPKDKIECKLKDGFYKSGLYGTKTNKVELVHDVEVLNGVFQSDLVLKSNFIWEPSNLKSELDAGTRVIFKTDSFAPRYDKVDYDAAVPSNLIDESCGVKTNDFEKNRLNDLGFEGMFDYPKPTSLMEYLLKFNLNDDSIVADIFAGSGSTGHAVIRMNRAERNIKYLLVEQGEYFKTVTKPRIKKVIYSDNWKNGKPQDKGGISQIVKYQILESYEDTLNNLFLKTNIELDFRGKVEEEYLLQYMLEMESREHLFNLEMFRKPFNYQLKVTENNELKPTQVDLVETFNYLIGLYVSKVQRVKDIKVVEGITRTGVKTLVIWRDLDTTTHDEVEKLLRRFYDSQRTKEFQQIYINGDHHLENLRSEGEQFKIKLIEETFFKKMFNEVEL